MGPSLRVKDDSLRVGPIPRRGGIVCLGDAGRWVDREQRCLQAEMGSVETGQAGALGIFRVHVGLQASAVKLLEDAGQQ